MVKSTDENKLVKLLGLNTIIVSLIFVAASALSGYANNAREQFIISRVNDFEERVYALETITEWDSEALYKVQSLVPLISGINYDLRTYARQEMIGKSFYEKYDEKLVSLTVLYMKTLRIIPSDKVLIQFFCTYDSSSCDYENFVLSYLINKYAGKIITMYFDGDSTHPLIRMVREKHGVEEFPFMIIEDEVVKGFLSAEELERKILIHVNNSSQT